MLFLMHSYLNQSHKICWYNTSLVYQKKELPLNLLHLPPMLKVAEYHFEEIIVYSQLQFFLLILFLL